MRNTNSWKKPNGHEISMMDIIEKIVRSWKVILCYIAAGTLIVGGYGYYKNHRQAVRENELFPEEITLTKEESEAVEEARFLQNILADQETYTKETVLMRINAYQENRAVLQYEITGVDDNDALHIMEQCIAYIENGGAVADILALTGNKFDLSSQYLQELIQTVYPDSIYNILNDSPNRYLNICILGENAEIAESLADAMEIVLDAYGRSIVTAPEQELVLLTRQMKIIYDQDLEQKKNALITNRNAQNNNLKSLVSQFTEEQNAVYSEDAFEVMPNIPETRGNVIKKCIKFVIAGMMTGAFLGCFWIVIRYLLSNKVKSIADMEINYLLPVFGLISSHQKNEIKDRQETNKILAQLLFSCNKKNLNNILLVSGHEMKKKLEYGNVQNELSVHGIKATVIENILEKPKVYKHLVDADAVVVLVEKEKTTYPVLDRTLMFLEENEVLVLGSIIVE